MIPDSLQAVAAVTFNSDRAAIDYLQNAARGRRRGPRGPVAILDDLHGALVGRPPGRRAATTEEPTR